jgi:hypothetical protein
LSENVQISPQFSSSANLTESDIGFASEKLNQSIAVSFMTDTICQFFDLKKSPIHNHSLALTQSKIRKETDQFTKSKNIVPTIMVGMSMRIAASQNQTFSPEMGISSPFSLSENITESDIGDESPRLNSTTVVVESSTTNFKKTQNVMSSRGILTQTAQCFSSRIGEATQTMIQSKSMGLFNFLMTKEISSTFADGREQSSFGIIMYVAISIVLAALGTLAVIVLILLRRRTASESVSKFGNRVNNEHTRESATEMNYHSFFDQTAFENPSSSGDNLMGLFAAPSSNMEELF